ncbi:MAG: hypothetical protein FWF50_04890 [Defluviitaleaceae bacterium]|nr:hypothetical protein [Defluviitaleaceae bacterium]
MNKSIINHILYEFDEKSLANESIDEQYAKLEKLVQQYVGEEYIGESKEKYDEFFEIIDTLMYKEREHSFKRALKFALKFWKEIS